MKKLRVLGLMHEDLIPPDDLDDYTDKEINDWKTEYDVVTALGEMGHAVLKLGARDELKPIRDAIEEWKPDIVFNLLEEFRGQAVYDQNMVGYLELLGVPYTGCNPGGLLLTRDKALSKELLTYHRIRVPDFAVFAIGRKVRRPRRLTFPLIVKSVMEDASLGISQASVVHDDDRLIDRVHFIHEHVKTPAIAEQFIEGRDIYVGIIGNHRLRVLPPQELVFKKAPEEAVLIATAKAKHDVAYQEKWGIDILPAAKLTDEVRSDLERTSKRIYRILRLSGYGRIDFRVDRDGRIFFLEANANPEIARYEEFASGAAGAGINYEQLLQRILNLGLERARSHP
ncbi:MAG: D-alanine--D-alanine ligase [Acidobacteriota bacterium]